MAKLESGINDLISQIGQSSSTGTSSDSSTGSSGSSALSALENSAANLFASTGIVGASVSGTLTSLLQSMQQSLQGAPVSGNVVNRVA